MEMQKLRQGSGKASMFLSITGVNRRKPSYGSKKLPMDQSLQTVTPLYPKCGSHKPWEVREASGKGSRALPRKTQSQSRVFF